MEDYEQEYRKISIFKPSEENNLDKINVKLPNK